MEEIRHCNWLQFVPPHSTKRLSEIEDRQRSEPEDQKAFDDIEYLLNYTDFLKANLRAIRNGLD